MGNATIDFPNDTAIFDTGSSHIFGPWDAVESIYKSLQGIFFHDLDSDDKSSYYALPCQAPENFSFSFGFGGKQFPVPYEALVEWVLQRAPHGANFDWNQEYRTPARDDLCSAMWMDSSPRRNRL
jgi:hypothetical protein